MGGPAGVCGSLQRPGPCLRSDCGVDWSSLLPPAASHQHGQVCYPLLLQEGESAALTQSGSQTTASNLTLVAFLHRSHFSTTVVQR